MPNATTNTSLMWLAIKGVANKFLATSVAKQVTKNKGMMCGAVF